MEEKRLTLLNSGKCSLIKEEDGLVVLIIFCQDKQKEKSSRVFL